MQKRITMICSFIIIFLLNIGIVQGKSPIIVDKGVVGTKYTVFFENQTAYLSRDGSEAIPISSNTTISKPGNYFLWLTNDKYSQGITFTLAANKDSNEWVINKEEEIEEILKYTMENFKTNITIKFNYGNFNIDELNNIFFKYANQLEEKYPKISFESIGVASRQGEKPLVKVQLAYVDKDINLLKYQDKWINKEVIRLINEKIDPAMVDYEREFGFYTYLIENTRYSDKIVGGQRQVIDTPMTHTIYGALKEGVAVCDGYAKSLMYLLNAVGVPTKMVTGEGEGIPHAWNMVKIQNQNYHVDSTWGDKGNDQIGGFYDYFNETDDYIAKTHLWDKKSYPKCYDTAYSFSYIPLELKNVYKVKNTKEWQQTLEQFAREDPSQSSIIFYDENKYKWEIDKLVNELCNCLDAQIQYQVIKKYNNVIISFRQVEK